MNSIDESIQDVLQHSKTIRNASTSNKKSHVLHKSVENDVASWKKLEKLFTNTSVNLNLTTYSSVNKVLALRYFAEKNELEGISHLLESHAVFLRQQILQRSSKTKFREQFTPQLYGLNSCYINFDHENRIWHGEVLTSRLEELPKEWHVVQITAQYKPYVYEHKDGPEYPMSKQIRPMHAIHITVLPTGKDASDPVCITLPAPTVVTYDALKEIGTILHSLRNDLKACYTSSKLYWKMRETHDNKMKTALGIVEKTWLREWRTLLSANFLEEPNLIKEIRKTIDDFINKDSIAKKMSQKDRWLLKKIAVGSNFLEPIEITRAIKTLLPESVGLVKKMSDFLRSKTEELNSLSKLKRKNVILIIDERMDQISFESLEILRDQPVTRMPSFHIMYALFKEFEHQIQNGCKVVKFYKNLGSFIVNPSLDLFGSEKRLKIFNDYWLPNWSGTYGKTPLGTDFESILVNKELLTYNGHGSGIQYLAADAIEKLVVKTVVMLFGCGSIQLMPCGGRYSPFSVSDSYLTAKSPSIMGMLWAITDTDIDRFTVKFLSKWLKSEAARSWSDVDEKSWRSGLLIFKKSKSPKEDPEPEMLRAIATSRWACSQLMTSASVVVRGLPIKLVYEQ